MEWINWTAADRLIGSEGWNRAVREQEEADLESI